MKIAVIGGGTAGCMAAAHISKYFPSFDLYHIYDSKIPTIGVGEGTQANYPEWLEKITQLNFCKLQERCNITRKFGIQFEKWGVKNKQFMHNFYPINSAHGYHISADKLGALLKEHISATHINKKVIDVKSDGVRVNIAFEDNTHIEVDFAFDASGFPKTFDNSEYTEISLIPTNAALIHRGPVVDFNAATRSIARPHGWIFIIPLTTHTSYGYVYNSSINSREDIETDLNVLLQEELVTPVGESKHVTFPNFTSRKFFDGSLFKIGNAASFLEPLEATALGITLAQINYASTYLEALVESRKSTLKRLVFDEIQLKVGNEFLHNMVWKVALFVSWHYASGSYFNTDFWHFAQSNFKREMENIENKNLLHEFARYLKAGGEVNYLLFFTNINFFKETFVGLTPSSFCEVGYGIGFYS